MNIKNKVQVVIGAGPLGMAVMEELMAQGFPVRVVTRSNSREPIPGTEWVIADVSDPAQAGEACRDASVVYHCAMPPYTDWPRSFPPLTEGILEGTKANQAKLVFGDNLYAHGAGHHLLHEEIPLDAATSKGKVRAAMQQALLEAHQRGDLRVTIGKASDFFGPRVLSSHMGERIFSNILNRKPASFLTTPDQLHSYTYINDFARGLVILGQREEADGQVWHIPNAQTLTTREFIGLIANQVGRPNQISVMPKPLLNLLSLFIPFLREVKEMLYEFEQPFVVDQSKFVNAFGDIVTPLEQAIKETIAWYQNRA